MTEPVEPRELERLREQNAALRTELEETNQGVLALYAELDNQAEALRRASELKSRFLSYMSHEFRTPLGSILSIARLLNDELDGPLNSEQHKQVEFVAHAARELSEMVDDLLDLAKIEAGRITMQPVAFEVDELFAALRGMFRPIVRGDGPELLFEPHDGVPPLRTDDKKLAQVLRNLVSNALKFTPHGQVRVGARPEGAHAVRFTVSDTGIGIPPELQAGLFEDFMQVESPLQRHVRGTGLGLSLCRRFAELLGGHVGVQSTPGVGSVFHVTIPCILPEGHRDAA